MLIIKQLINCDEPKNINAVEQENKPAFEFRWPLWS
jgi:hypothetical protein